MCLLCVMKPNETPTRAQLLIAADNNPHGFGYAIHCGDRILTGRGMNAEEVIDRFLRIRSGMPDTWAMFHARITTHGNTDKSNCHPFRMNGDPSTVIGHNGIIPIDVPKGDHRSDTRIFADEWLPELLTELDNPEGFKELEDLVGYSKVAVFTHDPRLKYQVYILNEEMGHWTGDIWWSNDTYKPSLYTPKYAYAGSYGSMDLWDIDGRPSLVEGNCGMCHSMLDQVDVDGSMCSMCMSCLDCYADLQDCLCYRQTTRAYAKYEHDLYGNQLYSETGDTLVPYGTPPF